MELNKSNFSAALVDKDSGNNLSIPLYLYVLVSLANFILFVLGLFGNILVIYVIIKVKNMRTPTNVYLLNLSAADVLVLLVCQPAGLLEFFGKDRWFLGEFMCKLVPFMENGVLHVSIMTMLGVTLERYLALCHPFKRKRFDTIASSIKIVVVIWVIGFIVTLPFLFMTEHEDAQFYNGSPIKVCRTKVNETWRYVYTLVIVIIFFALPFLVLICIYSQIIRRLTSDTMISLSMSDRSSINTLRSRRQVVKMLIIIIILFFVSLFPIRLITLWLIFTPSDDVTKIGLEAFLNITAWARVMMYLNSAGNPVIYSLTSSKFKMAFTRVLRRQDSQRNTATMSTRYNIHDNSNKPADSYKRIVEDKLGHTSSKRRHNDPYLVVKFVVAPVDEHVDN